MFKKASKLKLRIQTSKGMLSIEQLWDLPVEELDEVAVRLEKEYKASGKKSFLEEKSKKDTALKLSFDIVLDILQDKVAARNKASKAAETKAHNQKILGLIAKKQDGELEEMSVEELEKQLK